MSLTRTSPSKQPLGSRVTIQLGWGPLAGSLARSGGRRDPPLEKMTGGSQERLASLFPLKVGRGPVAGRVGTSGSSHLFPAARQTHGVTSGPWAPAHSPAPPPSHTPRVPGSFNHLGTLPRSLLTGWAVPRLGSGGPTAPSSAAGSNSRGAGSGAGGGGGVPAALDMHLETGTKAEVPGGGRCAIALRQPLRTLTWLQARQLQMGRRCVPAAWAPGRCLQEAQCILRPQTRGPHPPTAALLWEGMWPSPGE